MASSYQDYFKKVNEAKKLKGRPPRKLRIPWRLVSFLSVLLFVMVASLLNFESVERWLRRIEIGIGPRAEAAEESAPSKAEGGGNKAKESTEKKADGAEKSVKVAEKSNEEDLDHLTRLKERKIELDHREQELNKLEEELGKQKGELEKRLTELEDTRKKISGVLEDRVKLDEKKIESLVQLYSSMKPQAAAKVLEETDEDLVVQVLGQMKKNKAAEIVNLMNAKKAQTLTEKYAGFRK